MVIRNNKKILLYSHDSYGLGHLRRSQTIAQALVVSDPALSVIIVSGSSVIGRFEFPPRVDFVRIPGVVKLPNGDYDSQQLSCSIQDLIKMRSDLILSTFTSFKPDLVIVDKEPLGLRGEMLNTLAEAQKAGVPVILGLRDILDDSVALVQEWTRKNVFPSLEKHYKEIWVYGPQQMGNPLDSVPLSQQVIAKTHFTGYLHRTLQPSVHPLISLHKISLAQDYMLVMAGGGGDGEQLMRAMLGLYEARGNTLTPAILLLGPFMPQVVKDDLQQRAENIPNLEIVYFSNQVEMLISKAKAVVSMGGYNSFCEILSFQKPAMIYPRTVPRMEQHIRISRAADLGLVQLLSESELENIDLLHQHMLDLPGRKTPQHQLSLDGLNWIADRVKYLLSGA